MGGSGRGAPVTEYDEQQELEAARERNDLDVADLREMSVAELRQVGRELELETPTDERKEDLVDAILKEQTERAGLDYASGILDIVDEGYGFMRRHGLLPSARGRLRLLQPGPPLRPPHRRPRLGRRARPARAGEVLGPPPGRQRQRRRHRDGPPPPGLQRPDPGPPGRAHQPRERPEEPEPAARQPRQPDRQGPARPDRQPAEGRQDDAPEGDRQRDQRQLPGHPPDGRPHRRAARGGHGHAPAASRARSSPRPSTSPRRITPTWPRWPWRSPSARSRPGGTS